MRVDAEGDGVAVHFSIETGEYCGFPLLHLSGELDMAAELQLRREIASVVGENSCALFHVLDVTYSDANSLEMLVRARDVYRTRGGHLAFVCCQASVFRELELLGLADHVDYFDNLEEAVDFLSERCTSHAADASSSRLGD